MFFLFLLRQLPKDMHKKIPLFYLLGAAFLTFYFSVYSIEEAHQAIQLRNNKCLINKNGTPIIKNPGLYFKLPISDRVLRWDTRIQHTISRSIPLITTEEGNLHIQYGITWRINHIENYIAFITQEHTDFDKLIDTWIKGSLKKDWKPLPLAEITENKFTGVKSDLEKKAKERGIELLAFKINQKSLDASLRKKVLDRMQTNQRQIASEIIKKGQTQVNVIREQANAYQKIALANAYEKSENIKSEADALITQMSTEAYRKNPKFAFFYQRLMSYKRSFNTNKPSVIVMQTDAPLLL